MGSTGTYDISGGSLTVNGNIIVGDLGQGTFNQTGGAVSANGLTIGNSGSSVEPVDTYNLTGDGSTLNVSGDEVVGNLGNGNFVQGNGTDTPTHSVTGTLFIGEGPNVIPDLNSPGDGNGSGPAAPPANPREGNFTMNSGSLDVGSMVVGDQGTGTFVQNGGSVTVANDLDIGAQAPLQYQDGSGNLVGGPSSGTLTIYQGTLLVGGTMTVGDAGNGTLNVNGGEIDVAPGLGGTIQIGVNGTGTVNQIGGVVRADFVDLSLPAGVGTSTYTISGGELDTVFLNVGGLGNGATFTQTGNSTVNVSDTLYINSNGSYTIDPILLSTTLNVGNNLVVNGSFSQGPNSTVTVGADSSASGPVGTQQLVVDNGGQYSMSAGALVVYGNSSFDNSAIEVGAVGSGTFTQSGGTVDTYGVNGLAIGDCCTGPGEYDLSNGTLTIHANPTYGSGNMFVGAHSDGTMNQTGGAVSVAGNLYVGLADGASGQYTINDFRWQRPTQSSGVG